MTLPIHRNPSQEADRALAPYNFVELPSLVLEGDPPVARDHYATADRLTGHILCQLTTETPLYTRAALTKDEYELRRRNNDRAKKGLLDDKADFFYIDEATRQPVIPGSSLRGMLRTLAEIIGYGKIDAVSEELLVYRSVDTTSHGLHYRERLMQFNGVGQNSQGKNCRQYTPLMRAGYLHCNGQDEWRIQPAQVIDGTTFARITHAALERFDRQLEAVPGCKNARFLYFQPGRYEYQDVRGGFLRIKMAKVQRASAVPGKDLIKGTLARSGNVPSKSSEVVVFPENDAASAAIPLPDAMIETYRAQISQEQAHLLGPDGALNDGQPIFYLVEDGKLIFFGHTMMMRLPYEKNAQDFVPSDLRDNEQTDLVEALFGYVAQGKPQKRPVARAGRLFVSDAKLCDGQQQIWLEAKPLTPKILATPKPTTFQHYLVQRNPDPFQNGVTRDGRPKYSKELADYTAEPGQESVIRGHKQYWHKGAITAAELKEDVDKLKAPEEETQHTQIRPVAPGVSFTFKIHFENLSAVEVGLLLWVLLLPGQRGVAYRHKLGMGKPLGMGSVHLQPHLVLSDRTARYRALFDETGWATAETIITDLVPYLHAFEAKMLAVLPPLERGNQTAFAQIPRIQTLLTLLAWPGPAKSQTRYLEIEHEDPTGNRQKINEYRPRPVLPTPKRTTNWGNLDDAKTLAARTEETLAPVTLKTAPFTTMSDKARGALTAGILARLDGVDQAIGATPHAETEIANNTVLQSKGELTPGRQIEGKVVRVEPSRVVLEILGEEATLQKDDIQPRVRNRDDMAERFPIGALIRVRVKRVNPNGRIQVRT
jgi:CRISPR-associated protein (TIGR03986 family)